MIRPGVIGVTVLAACSSFAQAQSDAPHPASLLPPTFDGAGMPSRPARAVVDLSEMLEGIRSTRGVPGIAALMLDRDGPMARGVAGVRKAGGTTPVMLTDRWHLGSCGKAMTGTLAALLVKDGTLNWDTTIGDVFNPKRPPEPKSQITNNWRLPTIRQLITCTANAPNDMGEYGGRPLWANLWEKARTDMPPQEQRAFLFGELLKANIGVPTTGFQYANASLAVAGHMAEVATDTPFEQLVQARLFKPLGITSAGFGAPGEIDGDDQPWGHNAKGEPVSPGVNADNPPSIAPAGTMHMSIEDWGRFVQMHLIGAEISLPVAIDADTPQAEPEWNGSLTLGLGPSDFAVLHASGSPRGDYAAGWIITNRPQWAKGTQEGATGRCLTHAGSNTFWTASVWIAPEIGRAFVVVVNSGAAAGSQAREEALLALINLDRRERELPAIKP